MTNYLSGDPSQPAPGTQAAPTTPATNLSSYSFIVQAETPGGPGFSYDVTVKCKYSSVPPNVQTGTQVSTDVAFTSVPPKVASLSIDHIAPKMWNASTPDGLSFLDLLTANDGTRAGAGIAINATTQASSFSGTFMYLNLLLSSDDIVKDGGTGAMISDPTVGGGSNVDSGTPLAYNGFFWKGVVNDPPFTDQNFQDSPGVDKVPPSVSDVLVDRTYATYLMFKPDDNANGSGVWVALDKVAWSFSETVKLIPAYKLVNSTPPKASEASAVGIWPTWTANTDDKNPASDPPSRFIPYSGPDPF